MDGISVLNDWIAECKNIVFFGGAGVSTESGIPDFRSQDGLYNQKYAYPPEEILSHGFLLNNPAEFYKFYRDKILNTTAKPNITHFKLAELEREGKLSCVITQNIDGLHQAAGSRTVYELHGSIHRNYCMKCGAFHSFTQVLEGIKHSVDGVPRCACGGMLRPDVVLYGEELNMLTVENSLNAIARADMLIVGGTSLNVYPAAGLVNYFKGRHTVLINKSQTPFDGDADLVIRDKLLGEVFSKIEC